MTAFYCDYINRAIAFNEDKILYCTIGNNAQNKKLPIIRTNFDGSIEDLERVFEKIREHRNNLKEGIAPDFCKGCYLLKEVNGKYPDVNEELKYVLLSNWYACNSKCVYCCKHEKSHWVKDDNKFLREEQRETYNIVPVIKYMISKGMITENTTVDFAGAAGEPTLYKYFDEIIQLLIDAKVAKIVIHTNAIRYNKLIEYGISIGLIDIVVSIDAGSKHVHRIIKQVNTYDKVWKHIQKYAKAKYPLSNNSVTTKYIIVPEINDNIEEISKFVQKSKASGVTKLILNADDRIYRKDVEESYQEKLLQLTEFFVDLAKKNHFRYYLFSGVFLPYWNLEHKLKCVFPQYKESESVFE